MMMGDDLWWDVVRTSTFHEADHMLRAYRSALLEEHPPRTPGYADAGTQVRKINDEIHRLAQLQQRTQFRIALMSVCGPDVFAQVIEEQARLEHMARLEYEAECASSSQQVAI